MTLGQLRMLVEVGALGGFSRAARSLRRLQPGVSQAIAALEEELGVTLVRRARARVTLTEAGQRVAGRARAVLDGVEDIRATASAARGIESGHAAPGRPVQRRGHRPARADGALPVAASAARAARPARERRGGSALARVGPGGRGGAYAPGGRPPHPRAWTRRVVGRAPPDASARGTPHGDADRAVAGIPSSSAAGDARLVCSRPSGERAGRWTSAGRSGTWTRCSPWSGRDSASRCSARGCCRTTRAGWCFGGSAPSASAPSRSRSVRRTPVVPRSGLSSPWPSPVRPESAGEGDRGSRGGIHGK